MPEIVLSPEQAKVVVGAGREIVVRNPEGGVVGCLVKSSFTPEEIEEAKRLINSGERPTRTTAQVWENIYSLERGVKYASPPAP